MRAEHASDAEIEDSEVFERHCVYGVWLLRVGAEQEIHLGKSRCRKKKQRKQDRPFIARPKGRIARETSRVIFAIGLSWLCE